MSILNTITAQKKADIELRKKVISEQELQKKSFFNRVTYSFKDFIADNTKTGIITEFKRKSPSKGIINGTADILETAKGYESAGASAISILTDTEFFGGSEEDILKVREYISVPILRKDFIIDEYQVYESKAMGADVILLIAAVLDEKKAFNLAKLAGSLQLQVLMEFHDIKELELLNEYVDVAGINNRNLNTFEVSLEHSVKLASMLPSGLLKIAESGISGPGDVLSLRKHGFHGFLIGEYFMKHSHPASAFASFAKSLK